jgi:nicotinamide-nucleotide amidase
MDDTQLESKATELIAALERGGYALAVAESLTGGQLAMTIARMPESSEVFLGGLVSYHRIIKHQLLGTELDRVVTPEAAVTMAQSTRDLFASDVAVAVTGVAGPDEQDGVEVGTVFGGWAVADNAGAERWHFDGDPAEICRQTIDAALRMALRSTTELLERTLEGRPSPELPFQQRIEGGLTALTHAAQR